MNSINHPIRTFVGYYMVSQTLGVDSGGYYQTTQLKADLGLYKLQSAHFFQACLAPDRTNQNK